MENRQFVDGYQDTYDRYSTKRDIPEVMELMEIPREWSSFFDTHLADYLAGNPTEDKDTLIKHLEMYETDWTAHYLNDDVRTSQQLTFFDSEAQIAVNELTFHILSKEFMPLWRHILTPETAPEINRSVIEKIQIQLALKSAELAKVKKDSLYWQRVENRGTHLPSSINGQLTELDAAIVMLETVKDDCIDGAPYLILLPAPPRFESSITSTNRSADFILIDTYEKFSQGIQVKTYIDSFQKASDHYSTYSEGYGYRPTKMYDTDFVTLIDGMIDLGNSSSRFIPGKGTQLVPEPGLIAENFLKDGNNLGLSMAKNHIENRIFRDMYKEE